MMERRAAICGKSPETLRKAEEQARYTFAYSFARGYNAELRDGEETKAPMQYLWEHHDGCLVRAGDGTNFHQKRTVYQE